MLLQNLCAQTIAQQMATVCPKARLDPRALAYLESKAESIEPWCVACSGGADSVFVFLLLLAYYGHSGRPIAVLHYNHNQRQAESDGDAQYVEALAKHFGCQFYQQTAPSWLNAKLTTEAVLRKHRHAFFQATLQAIGSRVLVLGHQQEDVAESLIMGLLRGVGSAGLAAPRPIQTHKGGLTYVRPLLTIRKAFIESCLQRLEVPWREDHTNQKESYLRNRVRKHVIPVLEKVYPSKAITNMSQARARLEADAEALHAWLAELYPEGIGANPCLNARPLTQKPNALVYRALTYWLAAHGLLPKLNRAFVDRCVQAFKAQEKGFQLAASPNGKIALVYPEFHYTCAPQKSFKTYCLELPEKAILCLPNGYELFFCNEVLNTNLKQAILRGDYPPQQIIFANPSALVYPLTVRTWRAGDAYRPLGSPGNRKLQDMFVDLKISASARRTLPILCDHTGSILWCPGLPPAASLKISLQASNVVVVRCLRS